jgi:hypothetical protein
MVLVSRLGPSLRRLIPPTPLSARVSAAPGASVFGTDPVTWDAFKALDDRAADELLA